MPWKFQGEKEKCEGEKEDGQRREKEEKRKGERMREIALWRIFDFCQNIVLFTKVNLGTQNNPV